jgi:hypothetical protein
VISVAQFILRMGSFIIAFIPNLAVGLTLFDNDLMGKIPTSIALATTLSKFVLIY